jgi:thioredoxin 1
MAIITVKKFSKPGCVPCKVLGNYLGDIDLFGLGATLENIDITEQPEVIEKYNLSSVPVLVMERSGVEVTRINGLRGTEEIIDAIEHAKVAK